MTVNTEPCLLFDSLINWCVVGDRSTHERICQAAAEPLHEGSVRNHVSETAGTHTLPQSHTHSPNLFLSSQHCPYKNSPEQDMAQSLHRSGSKLAVYNSGGMCYKPNDQELPSLPASDHWLHPLSLTFLVHTSRSCSVCYRDRQGHR